MATAVFRYPLDVTGENPDNYVAAEHHSLVPKSDLTDVRVIVPLYGPFFGDSVRIIDRANGRQLDRSEYKITDLLQDPTLITGKEIGQFIVVTNGMVSNEVEIHYQVLGGNYQNDSSAIQHVYETFLNDYRPVDWTNISGKPLSYPPSLHIHLLEDVIGFGPLVTAIENLREAIILKNIPMYESLIDWVNQRTTDWSKITNRPTSYKDLGLTDVVPITRRVIAGAGLTGGGSLDNDVTIALPDTGVVASTFGSAATIPVIRTDAKGRIVQATEVAAVIDWRTLTNKPTTTAALGVTDVVNHLRRINTSNGIEGGGDLRQDLNLMLTDTGVIQGVYGDDNTIPSFTVDLKGRIVSAQRISLNLAWERVTGKPTTLAGYGITNGVDISSWQQITGHKHFDSLHAAHGSTAANPDNGATSRIATEDWVNRLINSKLGSGSNVNGISVLKMGNLTVCNGYGPNGNTVVWLPVTYTEGATMVDNSNKENSSGGDGAGGGGIGSGRTFMTLRGTLTRSDGYTYAANYNGSAPIIRNQPVMWGSRTVNGYVNGVSQAIEVDATNNGYRPPYLDYSKTPFIVMGRL